MTAKQWWSNQSPKMKEILASQYFECKPSELNTKQIVYIHFNELPA